MHLDKPFPLDAVPSRVAHVLLREFKGRCPSIQEVDHVSDKLWLATPGMGPASLQTIRSITSAARQQEVSDIAPYRLSDTELLMRLQGLQEDLRWLEAQLKARLSKSQRRRPQRREHNSATRNQTGLPGHGARETEASEHQNNQDHLA